MLKVITFILNFLMVGVSTGLLINMFMSIKYGKIHILICFLLLVYSLINFVNVARDEKDS